MELLLITITAIAAFTITAIAAFTLGYVEGVKDQSQ